jgi:hypothetical protein
VAAEIWAYYRWAKNNTIHHKCEECRSLLEIDSDVKGIVVVNPFFLQPKSKMDKQPTLIPIV